MQRCPYLLIGILHAFGQVRALYRFCYLAADVTAARKGQREPWSPISDVIAAVVFRIVCAVLL